MKTPKKAHGPMPGEASSGRSYGADYAGLHCKVWRAGSTMAFSAW